MSGNSTKKEKHADGNDPVLRKFLEFLSLDMSNEPARIRPLPKSLMSRGKALVKGVRVDLDAPPTPPPPAPASPLRLDHRDRGHVDDGRAPSSMTSTATPATS
jgi:hypothetical protein